MTVAVEPLADALGRIRRAGSAIASIGRLE
jgi:hypothetical protein